MKIFLKGMYVSALVGVIIAPTLAFGQTAPATINVLLEGYDGPGVTESDIYRDDIGRYRTFKTACDAAGYRIIASTTSSEWLRCPNQSAGAEPNCYRSDLSCEPLIESPSSAPGGSASQNSPDTTSGDRFIPLTNLPGIKEAASSETLPIFLNNLYRLCIGAAAVIAVIQIMQGGFYFMFNKGSVAHNEKAKSLIGNAVLGLLLVLSPAIVFGIINPSILSLKLDTSGLKLRELQQSAEEALEQQTAEELEDYTRGNAAATGSVLKKATFSTEGGMTTFVNGCSQFISGRPAQAITRGCTRTCSPGVDGCPDIGCTEYTAYCAQQETFLLVRTNSRIETKPEYDAHPDDQQRMGSFVLSCRADGGKFKTLDVQDITCRGGELVRTNPLYPNGCVSATSICSPDGI